MDVQVVAGDGEPLESLLRRFKREVNNSGHLMELKHRRYFENGQDIIKRKIKEVPETHLQAARACVHCQNSKLVLDSDSAYYYVLLCIIYPSIFITVRLFTW
jgi:ribosomal protein S21